MRYGVFFCLSIFCCGSFVAVQSAYGEEASKQVRGKMQEVYQAYRSLQRYLASETRFEDPKNEKAILKNIDTIRTSFHSDSIQKSKAVHDPGFQVTLQVLMDLLNDSRNRFESGRKQYALWRLRTASNYCVTCHTRHKVKYDFAGGIDGAGLDAFEAAETMLASRQFEKAADAFLQVLDKSELRYRWMEALRKYLVIQTRVHPEPKEAIVALQKVLASNKLVRGEAEEVQQWVRSLERWRSEKPSNLSVIQEARRLIEAGIQIQSEVIGIQNSVDLLRATAILHSALDNGDASDALSPEDRAEALYLLGLSYSRLPTFFINELPELFLELAIRGYPGSVEAQRAYHLYQELILIGFSGSSGLHLPGEVKEELRELHDIAYGVRSFKPRV